MMVTTVAVTKHMQYILNKWLMVLIFSLASFDTDGKLTFRKNKACLFFFVNPQIVYTHFLKTVIIIYYKSPLFSKKCNYC